MSPLNLCVYYIKRSFLKQPCKPKNILLYIYFFVCVKLYNLLYVYFNNMNTIIGEYYDKKRVLVERYKDR